MLGDSLSNYKNLQCITGRTPEEIKSVISQLYLPSKIIAIYAVGNIHYCWINISEGNKIKKIKKEKIGE
jgi:hypothetical protein